MNFNPEDKKILIADDDNLIVDMISDALELEGYQTIAAHNGIEAVQYAHSENPDILILDINMPKLSGIQVMHQLNEEIPGVPFIFLTGEGDLETVSTAFTKGAVDYLMKPMDINVLIEKVRVILEKEEKLTEKKKLRQSLWKRENELREVQLEVITHLAAAAEYKDNETGMHIKRMAHYAALTAAEYGMSKKDCYLILNASPMHDIGKVGIPDRILLKPGPLNEEEWVIMKTHAAIGSKILVNSRLKLLKIAATIAVSHHEKWNGKGYPQGLSGNNIPIWGRITAIADVFDALTSKRPYKEAWNEEKAFELIRNEKGNHFDPDVTDAFFRVLPDIRTIKNKYQDNENEGNNHI